MAASGPNQLPAVWTTPLDRAGAEFPRMGKSARRLLETAIGSAELFMVLKTRTRVDVGEWFWNGRVWLGVTAQAVTLLASGRKPFVQAVPFDQLRDSLYNHITGEVVLAPAKELKVKRVKLPALAGYQLLAQIYSPAGGGQNKET